MPETLTTAAQRRGPAWCVVAVLQGDVALIVQNSLARIITGAHADEPELFAQSERAEESGAEEDELAEAFRADLDQAPASSLKTSVGEDTVLATLEHPSASGLFILAPDSATQQWLDDHRQGSRDVLRIDVLEEIAAPHVCQHAKEPLDRLRSRSPEDALALAMQVGSRAFWALNADVAKDKHGITARNRERILAQARASGSERGREPGS
jgi:hypothetical protein